MFILREYQTLIWTPKNSRRRPAARRPADKDPKGTCRHFKHCGEPARSEPRSTCRGNYHDEEKTLGMILPHPCPHMGLPLRPSFTHTKWLGGLARLVRPSVPVRAHLYVTNFTRGVQVGVEWDRIRVKYGLRNGRNIFSILFLSTLLLRRGYQS